jgi:hypothetical protein
MEAPMSASPQCEHGSGSNELRRDQILGRVAESVLNGRCIAFLGAGFAMPDLRDWPSLLKAINGRCTPRVFTDEEIQSADAFRLELMAQTLADELGGGFASALVAALPSGSVGKYRDRRELLYSIPFRSIVTTNFDDQVTGEAPDAGRMVATLRTARPVWTRVDEREGRVESGSVLKLHGEIGRPGNPVVLARRDYRARVHGRGGYSRLVSSAFALNDVLFLGTSFTDAYLNEIRSEVLSWFEQSGTPVDRTACLACQMPVKWWAVLPDANPKLVASMARHDGIEVITYDIRPDKSHEGFDEILGQLASRASLVGLLRARLTAAARRRRRPAQVWWCDDERSGNELGARVLREALGEKNVRDFSSPEEIANALRREAAPILVITKFKGDEGRFAFPVLEAARPTSTPVIVFGWHKDADDRRWAVRSRGAVDYTHQWRDLFRVIAELFESEDERSRRLFDRVFAP